MKLIQDETKLSSGGSMFRMEQDYEQVATSAPERDPKWTHTDSHGHEHKLVDGEWPTLRWVLDAEWIDADGDERTESHWECLICGDHVEPGMRYPGHRVLTIPTMRHYFIDEREVGEDEFNRAVERARTEQT